MDWLFEMSLLVPVAVMAAAVAVWVYGNRRTDDLLKRIAYGLIALAVVLAAVSLGVSTPRETVDANSRALIAAASGRDWPAFAALLHSGASIKGFDLYTDKATFAAGAEATVDNIGLRWARPIGVRVEPLANQFVAELDCMSMQEITFERPVTTSWRFTWAKEEGAWRLLEAEVLPRPQLSPEEVTGRLVGPPAPRP